LICPVLFGFGLIDLSLMWWYNFLPSHLPYFSYSPWI
jgi:hypothetical protein